MKSQALNHYFYDNLIIKELIGFLIFLITCDKYLLIMYSELKWNLSYSQQLE